MLTPQDSQLAKGFIQPAQDPDKFLRAVVDACASNVAVLDETGTILFASKAWQLFEKGYGWSRQSTSSDDFEEWKRFSESSASGYVEATLSDDIQRIVDGKEKEFHRKYFHAGFAEPRYFVTHAARLDLPASGFRVLVTHDDVGISREALKDSEDRLRQLLETTKIFVWESEHDSRRFTYVSKHAVKILGYPIEQWYKPDFLANHIYPGDEKRALSFCRQNSQLAEHYDLTFRMIASDGRLLWLQNLVSVTRENGKPTKMHGFMIDISERKRAEEALEAVSGRLIAAQEEERRRVARELHDDLNQRMALLSIELEQLAQGNQNPFLMRESLGKLQHHAREISADIHRISYKLHPSKLDHLGLEASVNSLCKELSESRTLRIEFKQSGFPATLPKDVTLCAFRIAQEALRNCINYSEAETVRVGLEKTDDEVRLSVVDDGRGFDMESDAMKKGLGFISMKERVHLVGGELQISSRPLRGTCIRVSIPLVNDRPAVDADGKNELASLAAVN
jgi:PAS domain S-box-containing protein